MNRDYRPKLKNGAVQRRKRPARSVRHRRAGHHLGPMLALLVAGLAITGGFVASLRSHFAAQRLSTQALVMKQQLDESRAERRDLEIKEQRELSLKAVQRKVGGARDLAPFQLDRPEILRSANPAAVAGSPVAQSPVAERMTAKSR